MPIRVCLAGATGWAGSELARAIPGQPDVAIVSAVSRKHGGQCLSDVLHDPTLDCPIYTSAAEALDFLSPLKSSQLLQKAHAAIRKVSPKIEHDRVFAEDFVKLAELIRSGALVK